MGKSPGGSGGVVWFVFFLKNAKFNCTISVNSRENTPLNNPPKKRKTSQEKCAGETAGFGLLGWFWL